MSFASQMEKAVANVKVSTAKQAKKITIDLLSSVVLTTPVLSGNLRGNWQASQKAPITNTIVRNDKTGDVTLQDMILQVNALPNDKDWVLYFTNNASYANRVEYMGHSQKAPYGMVRVSFTKIARFVDQAIRGVP